MVMVRCGAGGCDSLLRPTCVLQISRCAQICSATSAFMLASIKNPGCLGSQSAYMKRSFDSRVSMGIRFGLEIGIVKPLATPVLLSGARQGNFSVAVPILHLESQFKSSTPR